MLKKMYYVTKPDYPPGVSLVLKENVLKRNAPRQGKGSIHL